MVKNAKLVIHPTLRLIKYFPLFLLLSYSLCNPDMVQAQKIMDGIYFTEINSESGEFELIRFKSNQTFTNFHGNKSGNELGRGFITIENNQLTMEFEDIEVVTVFDKVDTFPDLGQKVNPSIILFNKNSRTSVGGAKVYVMGEENKAVISDHAGIVSLPPNLKVGSILIIQAKGFYTQELVYDGFFRTSYYLTNDLCYKSSDGPRQYNIINIARDSMKLSFSFDFGLLSSNVETYTMKYKKITYEKAKELLGYHPEYINFMLE